MNNVLSVMRPAYAPTSSDVRPSTWVTLASGATSHPLRTGSKIIGPAFWSAPTDSCRGGPACPPCAAAESGVSVSTMSQAKCLLLILCPQAHVHRRRLAAPHLHVGDVRAVARLLNLDRVASLGDLDDEGIVRVGAAPFLAVDQNVRIARLNANRDRPVRRRVRTLLTARRRRRRCLRRRGRRRWHAAAYWSACGWSGHLLR